MAEEFMRLVGKTTRFNKKRFSKHISLFDARKQNVHSSVDKDHTKNDVVDFFQNDKTSDDQTKMKKKEKKKKKKRSRGEAHDVALFAGDTVKNESSEEENEDDLHEQLKEVIAIRKQHKIHVQGTDIPAPSISFSDMQERFDIPSYIVSNLKADAPQGCGYDEPTPIQMQSIPIMMAGREILACAPTGSGKTAAFIIPVLSKLRQPDKKGFRALVLSPTKELADQLYRHFLKIGSGMRWRIHVLTKANANKNTFGKGSSKRKDILISTPLRLVHLIQTNSIDLSALEMLVLDEADRLFDLGFIDQVDSIVHACSHPKLHTCMFSATYYQGVEYLAKTVLRSPIRVTIGARNAAAQTIKQSLVFVGREDGKLLAMRQLIQKGLKPPVLIFVQSKNRAMQLFRELVYENINVDVIHSERSQEQRSTVMKKFRSGEVWVLICTDLMARGIDFIGVNCVINYDFPQTTVSYIHRVGRTGRAGRSGEAITFFTEQDSDLLRNVAGVIRQSGGEVPDWMLDLKQASKNRLAQLKQAPVSRHRIGTGMDQQVAQKKRKKSTQKKGKKKSKQSTD